MSATTLLLRCEGPMQSWGTRSRFRYRDTEREPTKSGVIGLISAALGRPREADPADLAALRMGVRVDRAGTVQVDFQTAMDVAKAGGGAPETMMSWRQYLADASFLVGLEGDAALLSKVHAALANPIWPLFLGRRSHVPSVPVWVPGGCVEAPLREALLGHPLPDVVDSGPRVLVLECGPDEPGDTRLDVPLDFTSASRSFAERRITRSFVASPHPPGGA